MTLIEFTLDAPWEVTTDPASARNANLPPSFGGPGYGPSIIPGAPVSPPPFYGAAGFAAGSLVTDPEAPSPFGSPQFNGLQVSIGNPVGGACGLAVCSGPAAVETAPGSGIWTVDPQALTVIDSWFFNGVDDVLSTWWPLTVGVHYYLVAEYYGDYSNPVVPVPGPFPEFLLAVVYVAQQCEIRPLPFGATGVESPLQTGFPTPDAAPLPVADFNGNPGRYLHATGPQAGAEQIFPIGQDFSMTFDLMAAADTLHVEIAWGDGTTETHDYAFGLSPPSDTAPTPEDERLIVTIEGNWVVDWSVPFRLGDGFFRHSYATPGTYTVTIAVSDGNGGSDTKSSEVVAVGKPTVAITVNPLASRLPGQVSIDVVGTSDAWTFLGAGSVPTNPDGYDPTIEGPGNDFDPEHGGLPVHSGWSLDVGSGDGYGSDHMTPADWEGTGPPPHAPDPATPLPDMIWFPADAINKALAALGLPAVIRVEGGDYFYTWQQRYRLDVDVVLDAYIRSFPRDDGLGMSSARSFPPQVDSIRSYPQIP